MKIAIYPGSFNPFHEGHRDVVEKAKRVFDLVIIAQGINLDKKEPNVPISLEWKIKLGKTVKVVQFKGLLSNFIKRTMKNYEAEFAIVRGLRNSIDFEYEKTVQYCYEDFGVTLPVIYFISDRKLSHISSSSVRAMEKAKKG